MPLENEWQQAEMTISVRLSVQGRDKKKNKKNENENETESSNFVYHCRMAKDNGLPWHDN